MRSTRPKPLHLLCGRPMLLHVLASLRGLEVSRTVVVVGHGAEAVTKKVQELGSSALRIGFVEQLVQRGTGDAVLVGMSAFMDDDLDESGDLLVLPGDTPLLRSETVAALVAQHRHTGAAATLLTARLTDPTGYGRISRDRNNNVARVVEHGDATEQELDDRRGEHVDLLLPPRPSRPGAATAQSREQPGRVLPHRCRLGAARRGLSRQLIGHRRSDRGAGGQ